MAIKASGPFVAWDDMATRVDTTQKNADVAGKDGAAASAVRAIKARNPKADPTGIAPDICPTRIPRHVAIIMDGNGRWATGKGMMRVAGHIEGAQSVRSVIETAGKLGIEYVTLYSFSMENWKRPAAEVDALMALYLANISSERQKLLEEGIRFVQIGRREGLPPEVQAAAAKLEAETAHGTAATLVLAVNYGSRTEIADAARRLAERAVAGEIKPEQIDEAMLAGELYTRDMPDPDLLIRTAGELRVSNYLLWQISYAELYVTDTLWPDFRGEQLLEAVRAYGRRTRKFGGLV